MPLPLIPIVIGVATAAVGVGKGAKAISDNKSAKNINESAQDILDKAQKKLSKSRDNTRQVLEALGNQKLNVCQMSLSKFVTLFEIIKNVELTNSPGLEELSKFRIDKHNFAQLKEVTILAGSLVSGTVSGAIAGGAVAFGAYGAAGALATASTGTAIATLSGAAATNATLAFFGGGALTAGGLGVAGGTMVLGGLVAGPALAVLGFVMGAKASKNLDNACANYAKAEEAKEQIDVLVSACQGIAKRAKLFNKLLVQLDENLKSQLLFLSNLVQIEGVDYTKYSCESKKKLAMLVATVQAVKAVLDTSILTKDGALTEESAQVARAVQKQLQQSSC